MLLFLKIYCVLICFTSLLYNHLLSPVADILFSANVLCFLSCASSDITKLAVSILWKLVDECRVDIKYLYLRMFSLR